MSSGSKNTAALMRAMREQAIAEVLKSIVPQLGSSNEFLGAEPSGKLDDWKLADLPPRVALSLIHFNYRATEDRVGYYEHFVNTLLRASVSFGRQGRKELVETAIGISGSGKGKMVKQKGWLQRHVTDRSGPQFEEVEEE